MTLIIVYRTAFLSLFLISQGGGASAGNRNQKDVLGRLNEKKETKGRRRDSDDKEEETGTGRSRKNKKRRLLKS